MRHVLSTSLLFLSCCLAAFAARAESAAPLRILTLADIHFDPFIACYKINTRPCPLIQRLRAAPAAEWPAILSAADTGEPQYRQDTNYVLLQANLREAKAAAKKNHADVVLVLGDTVGHDFQYYYKKYAKDSSQNGYQSFVKKTLEFVNLEIAATFPDLSVVMVVGNDDTYSRNYQSVPGGDFFSQIGALWSNLLKNTKDRAAMRSEFAAGGYYALDIPRHPELRLVVLNSVLFSTRSRSSESARAADRQLDWLQQQLRQAASRHQKILIALHIPPALDVYATRRWRLFTMLNFWKPQFLQRFKQELAPYHTEIIGIVSGHLHYDWEQTLMVGDHHDVSVVSISSVSPIFGNDPGFKIYQYSAADEHIEEYDAYSYPMSGRGTWSIEHAYRWLNRGSLLPETARPR